MYTTIHNKLFAYLEGKTKTYLLMAGYALVFLLAFIDYLTGELSFILFYLIPVFLVAWFVGKRSGLFICMSCSIASFIDKLLEHPASSPQFLHSWDFIIETSYLFMLGLMFSTLREKHDQEKKLARIDPLTRALNRRYLYELAEQEIYRSSRYNRSFTVAYIDLDNFKTVNDKKGHHVGDDLLCIVADTIQDNVRYADIVARIGGDEFVIILPETGAEHALSAITKLQGKLAAAMESRGWPVTFSIGMVTYNVPPESVDEMLKKADDLMYAVKSDNKNGLKHAIINEGQQHSDNQFEAKGWIKSNASFLLQGFKINPSTTIYLRKKENISRVNKNVKVRP